MKKEIVKEITKMSGQYTPYKIFADWVKMTALSIQNSMQLIHNSLREKREKEFLSVAGCYTSEEMKIMVKMNACLTEAYEEDITDVLGQIYMESGAGNGATGQFFTPFHVSEMCAKMRIPENLQEELSLYEPSCGSGGMIIAYAKALKEKGINYQRQMKVVAQDLDWNCVYMTYVQLSLLGINATVAQGNSLAQPYDAKRHPKENVFYTPMKMGVLL